MDRLSTVMMVVGVVASACGGADKPAPARSRVDAVQAAAPAQVDPKEFCEVWHEPDAAPALTLPKLTGPAPAASGRSRWINVWATWCRPCIEELPRLARWRDELARKADFELVFLAADGDPAAVQAFAKEHPEVVGSLALHSADALQPWAAAIGVPGQAVLPIHVFVDDKDRVRCVRTAGVGEGDRAAIEGLLMAL